MAQTGNNQKQSFCTYSQSSFIIMSSNGKCVQGFTFAGKKHITFCNDPWWAAKRDTRKAADEFLDFLKLNFPVKLSLMVVPATFKQIVEIG